MRRKECILIVLSALVFSERTISQVRMGFIAGPLFSTNTLNNVEIGVINASTPCFCAVKQVQTKGIVLYSAGFTIDYILSSEFSISAKTLFASKGWNENVHFADFNPGTSAVTFDSKDKFRINYFELPIYFVLSSSLGSKNAIFRAGFGGYLNFALEGKYEFHLLNSRNVVNTSGSLTDNATTDGLTVLKDSSTLIAINSLQKKITTYSANSLDIGASILLGIELGNGVHFDLTLFSGLKNILTSGFYPYPRTNRFIGLGISAGYYINKK